MKLVNKLGVPIGKVLSALPEKWKPTINEAIQKTMISVIKLLNITFQNKSYHHSSPIWHKVAVAATGGVGGFFGLTALPIELPASTWIMIRSIMDIAKEQGANMSDPSDILACIEVLALGGGSSAGEAATEYYAVRNLFAKALQEAAEFITQKGFTEEGAPALVKYITQVMSRFGVMISEEAALKWVPFVSAFTGSSINLVFITHFQNMARGHFTIRSLEKKYGAESVKRYYNGL